MKRTLNTRKIKAALSNINDRIRHPDALITTGSTPYELVYAKGLVKIRHYQGEASPRYAVPLVIVPPLAINNLIYDWFPDRSFIKTLLSAGFDVYLIDWGSPSRRHAHFTLNTYVTRLLPECLQTIRQHSGQQALSLHGWSMGGGLSLCYQAYSRDPNIRNIITVGTAVDGHANGQIGRQYAMLSRGLKRVGFSLKKVPARAAYTPAWVNVVGFKLSDPISSAQGYFDLIRNLDDREFVRQHATQSAFMDNLEAYPGGVIRDWMHSIWLENEGAKGFISLGKGRVFLKDVSANLLCIAGEGDKLANHHCCRPLMNMVGSEDKTWLLGPGGHTGIVSGKQAPQAIWPQMMEWLAGRSSN